MADKRSGGDKHEPTLELPKLFGRRRRASVAEEPPVERSIPAKPSDDHTLHTERPLVADEPTRAPEPPSSHSDEPSAANAGTEEPGARRAARTTRLLPPRLAAVLTGLIVGAAGTLLTYGSLRGCELLTGTGSCGGGPGLLLLVAIFAVMVLLGGALLKAWAVSDPRSTSFLAVGITAVVVMLTLLEAVFSLWIFLAVPLVTMAAYLVAHWVTTRFVEADGEGAGVDLR